MHFITDSTRGSLRLFRLIRMMTLSKNQTLEDSKTQCSSFMVSSLPELLDGLKLVLEFNQPLQCYTTLYNIYYLKNIFQVVIYF